MNGQNLINRAVEEQTDTRIEHLVFFSGGIGSWAAAKRLALRDDVDALTLLFSDTQIEDEDLYRFLDDAVANIRKTAKVDYVTIADGRDPWQVFEDVGFYDFGGCGCAMD